MKLKPQKLQALTVVPFWISVALVGVVAYHDPGVMKYFLIMNLFALVHSMIVLGSLLKSKPSD